MTPRVEAIPVYFETTIFKVDLRNIDLIIAPLPEYNKIGEQKIRAWTIECVFKSGVTRQLWFPDQSSALEFSNAWLEYMKTQTIYI